MYAHIISNNGNHNIRSVGFSSSSCVCSDRKSARLHRHWSALMQRDHGPVGIQPCPYPACMSTISGVKICPLLFKLSETANNELAYYTLQLQLRFQEKSTMRIGPSKHPMAPREEQEHVEHA